MKIIDRTFKISFIAFGLCLASIAVIKLFNIEISEQFRSIGWNITVVSAVIFGIAIIIVSLRSMHKYFKQDAKLFIKISLIIFGGFFILISILEYSSNGKFRLGYQLAYSTLLTMSYFYGQDKIFKNKTLKPKKKNRL